MADYMDLWYKDLLQRKSNTVIHAVEAWGECKRHTGPSLWYARVSLSIGPSTEIQIIDKLSPAKSARLRHEGWYDQIIFGVLDIMLTDLPSPYGVFSLTIMDAEIDEVGSRALAFRLAARDAVIKMLPQLW